MAYADYMHCPGCDGKVIYTGDRDYEDADGHPSYGPAGVVAWHEKCLEGRIAAASPEVPAVWVDALRRCDSLITRLGNALYRNAIDGYEPPDDPGLDEAVAELLAGSCKQPRCPLCCVHGVPLARDCTSCEDTDGGYLDWINDDEPQWPCPHGVGREVGRFSPDG